MITVVIGDVTDGVNSRQNNRFFDFPIGGGPQRLCTYGALSSELPNHHLNIPKCPNVPVLHVLVALRAVVLIYFGWEACSRH